jgi:hypothetical protein
MQIIRGGIEDRTRLIESADTFMHDLMLTCRDIDRMLIKKQITKEQFSKLIKEVDVYANH